MSEAIGDSPRPVVAVIPTYNEAENIAPLLRELLGADPQLQVLVADDNSPDGTGARVTQFCDEHPQWRARIHLSVGAKRGLGAAYKRAMAVALHELNAAIVVQMDADFSHDPREVGKLIALVRQGFDVAIGSRYIEHASIDANWHPFRRWLSNGGNWLARWIAGISGVRDCTSGFRALNGDALKRVAADKLPVNGYAFQIALLHRLIHHDARVVEHPIYFQDRARGATKLGVRDLLEFFLSVWALRFPSAHTFVKFAVTGASGIFINLLAFQILLWLGVHKYAASPIAIEVSILWNFFINNYWTFSHRELIGNKLVRGLRFNAVSLGTLLISFAAFFALTMLFPSWSLLVHQALAIVPAAFFNYFINSYWTFSDGARDSNRDATRDSARHKDAD